MPSTIATIATAPEAAPAPPQGYTISPEVLVVGLIAGGVALLKWFLGREFLSLETFQVETDRRLDALDRDAANLKHFEKSINRLELRIEALEGDRAQISGVLAQFQALVGAVNGTQDLVKDQQKQVLSLRSAVERNSGLGVTRDEFTREIVGLQARLDGLARKLDGRQKED